MHARQQHFLGALGVVVLALSANAYADFRLFLRNPAELQEIARNALDALFPDYAPSMDAPEFVLSERRAIIRNLVFREKGDAGRTLFRIGTVEAEFSIVPPALRRVAVIEPQGTIRINKDGSVNFDTGGAMPGTRPTLYGDLHVDVEGGYLRVINDFEGQGSDLLVTDVQASLDVRRDLSADGRGSARVGALFGAGDPLGDGPRVEAPGTPQERRFRPLFQRVSFEGARDVTGRARCDVGLQGGQLSAQLRSMIPPLFRRAIWDELAPGGGIGAKLRLQGDEQGLRVSASILPEDATIKPRGFPMDIEGIHGRFEVVVALPKGAPRPQMVQVGWEDVQARVKGGGTCWSRGTAYPGRPDENVTLMVFVDARGLPLSKELEAALPADIRPVYRKFDPQGSIERARVLIFKGPWLEEPQLAVHIDELAGTVSAAYQGFPLRLQHVRGQFDIREDANVEIHAGGQFVHGGTGRIDAHVVRGDLMAIDVRGKDIPVGPELLAILPPGVHAKVGPFRPDGGKADVHVHVEKPHERALAQPTIDVGLRDVTISHEEFPFPLTTTGTVRCVPRFPAGATIDQDPDPSHVELALQLVGHGEGVVAAVVSGAIVVGEAGVPGFRGKLEGNVRSVRLHDALRDALPKGPREAYAQLAPTGEARDVVVELESPERFTARGGGDGLQVRPAAFAYPFGVDAFEVSREAELVRVHAARGRTPGDGRWSARGLVTLMAEGRPDVDLECEGEALRVDAQLVGALPAGDARDALTGMRPEGRTDASLRVRVPPVGDPRVEGVLDAFGTTLFVDRLHPSLVGLAAEPVRDLRGRIQLTAPGGASFERCEGTLAGAQVTASGRLVAPPEGDAAAVASLDVSVALTGFEVDERTPTLAGPEAKGVLARFRPSGGTLDLAARVRRGHTGPARVDLRLAPRDLTVVPDLFPLQVTGVDGLVVLEDGEPVVVDVTGRVGEGKLLVRRDRAEERAFPGGGARGRVFEVAVEGYRRPVDPRERAALERDLPADLLSLLTKFAPEGPVSAHAFLWQPAEGERLPIRWVAEVRAGTGGVGPGGDLAVSAGLRFDAIRGVVRASGTIPELQRGSCEGEVELGQLEWKKQRLEDVRGRFRLRDGVFTFGLRGTPATAALYGGQLRAICEYTLQTQQYRGSVGLWDGRMRDAAADLVRLREDDKQEGGGGQEGEDALPRVGRLDLQVNFYGGGKSLAGREVPLGGDGWLHISRSALLPQFGRPLRAALTGGAAEEEVKVVFDLEPTRLVLGEVELVSASGLTLYASGGSCDFDGNLQVTLVPFDTGVDLFQQLFENLPLTGWHLRGKVWAPRWVPLVPGKLSQQFEEMWRTLRGDAPQKKKD